MTQPLGDAAKVYRIEDKQPEFPCWLWLPDSKKWISCGMSATWDHHLWLSTHWTHSDTRPTIDPTAQPASTTEKKTEAPSLRSENAGHSAQREAAEDLKAVCYAIADEVMALNYPTTPARDNIANIAGRHFENFRGRSVNGIPASNGNGGCPVA